MDPLVAANRLPQLAERAMRRAVIAAVDRAKITPRAVIDDALVRFERALQEEAPDGVRPALLFTERDRIVRELRAFIDSRLATRLGALRGRDVVRTGRAAQPFDAIVRNRHGACYGLLLRRLPQDGARLELLRRMHAAAKRHERPQLQGVVVYDFTGGATRLVRESPREFYTRPARSA